MTNQDDILDARVRTIRIAEGIISGKLDMVSGSRSLCRLRFDIDESKNPVFDPIIGFESETDHYPLGDIRKLYNPIYLMELDEEIRRYVEVARPMVIDACKSILKMLGQSSH